MASYLFPNQNFQVEPYRAPLQLYSQALQVKDARLSQTLSNLRSKYDSVLSVPLTNEENQMTLRKGVESAMSTLSKVSVNDITLPENTSQINSLFDNILNDRDLMYDASWTRNNMKQIKKAEDLQKKDPTLAPPQNLDPIYRAQEQFRTAPKGNRPSPTNFTPYYNFDKVVNEELDKAKASVDRIFSVSTNRVEGPDGQMHDVSNPVQYTVKQLKDFQIQKIVSGSLGNNAQALHQMSLDYNYNTNYGLYPPEAAASGIESELSTYQNLSKGIVEALNRGVGFDNKALTDSDRDTYTGKQKAVTQEIERLQGLRNDIKLDPTKSNQWFTFNKFIKDYTEGKINQYAYKEVGLISSVPGLDKLTDYQLDVWKEQWKAKYTAEAAAAKEAAKNAKTAVDTPAPYNTILTQLASSPGGISVDRADIQALGQMSTEKPNDPNSRMFIEWSGDSKNPDNTIIMSPSNGGMSKQQISTTNANILLGKMNQELEDLGFKKTKVYNGGPTGDNLSIPIELTGSEILDGYSKNPAAADPKVKAIIDKYKGLLSEYKDNTGMVIDPTDINSRKRTLDQLNDPAIKNAVVFGTTGNLNGKFEFIPNQGVNLVRGDNGKMYMVGKIAVPGSKLVEQTNNAGKHYKESDFKGLISTWDVMPSQGEGDAVSTAKKVYESVYGISVYMPVNGDATKINDRLLDTQGYQKQWGDKAPENREMSRQKVLQMVGTMERSLNLAGNDVPLVRDASGNYKVSFSTGATDSQVKGYNDIIKIATEVSTRTGQDYAQTIQDVNNIFGTYSDPLSRQLNLENYAAGISNTSGNPQLPGTIDVDKALKAIASHEGGSLGRGTSLSGPNGEKGSASGTYQMIDSTVKSTWQSNFKTQYPNYDEFRKKFDTDSNFEYQVARAHLVDLINTYGNLAMGAWYSPAHTQRLKQGDRSVLNEIPGENYGNKQTFGNYMYDINRRYNKQ